MRLAWVQSASLSAVVLLLSLLAYACNPGPKVGLRWNASVPNSIDLLTYRIYRRPTGGQFVLIAGVTQARYVDDAVRAGATYTYQVTAFDAVTQLESAPSNQFTVTVP